MFTKGFSKTAWNANDPPPMPSAAAAAGVRQGLDKSIGQKMSSGWMNLKNELGMGKAQDTGHMNK